MAGSACRDLNPATESTAWIRHVAHMHMRCRYGASSQHLQPLLPTNTICPTAPTYRSREAVNRRYQDFASFQMVGTWFLAVLVAAELSSAVLSCIPFSLLCLLQAILGSVSCSMLSLAFLNPEREVATLSPGATQCCRSQSCATGPARESPTFPATGQQKF